ncbi:glycoside hydrolase [Streptomyces broussonetiae]|uniref:glycoside hydrolase n=1 Tax=Streptomyces broussonetiae TaxID=2686304 RepID=UPI00131E66B4|nr:glycoside hydrolase [Streptomyces broussonetiae]
MAKIVGAGLIASVGMTVPSPAADAAPPRAAEATTMVKVDPKRAYQNIEGWGSSLAWWAESTGGWSNSKDKNKLADKLFSLKDGLGLNVVRYDIGGSSVSDLCRRAQRTGAAVPTFEPLPGVYNWDADPNQVGMLKAAKARGANRFEAVAYSAPAWMTLDQCTSGGVLAGDNLNPLFYGAYTHYLATVVKHFHDTQGITFHTLDPFNEPVVTPWKFMGNQEGMNVSWPAQNAVLARLKRSLQQTGASAYTAISASDEQSVNGAVKDYQHYNAASRATVAQLNTHDYQDGQNGAALYDIGQRTGKPVWMSEWGSNGSLDGDAMNNALVLSSRINTNEQQMHPTAWSIWQAVDGGPKQPDDGTCNDLWGLVCTNIEPSGPGTAGITLPKRYYVMGNYSKFVRPGYRMIARSDPDTFSAYDAKSHTLVIVAANHGRSGKPVSYDLSGFAADGGVAIGHRTDVNENLAVQPTIPVASGRFADSLPPRSVTTYVVKATGSRPPSSIGKLAPLQMGQDMYVFGRAANGHAHADHWAQGVGWSGWQDLGGNLSSDVSAVQFGQQAQVFGVGVNGHAYGDVWDPGRGWSGWRDLGGDLVGNLSAARFGQQLQVFGVGIDGHAYGDVWDPGSGWSGWRSLGGQLSSDVAAVQFGAQMQVFGVGANGHAYGDVWDPGSGWSGWRDMGGWLSGDLSAVQFGQQMQLFGRAANGHAYGDVWDPGSGWSGWRDLGGDLVGNLSAARFGQQLQVFGVGIDGHAYGDVWDPGSGWSGWRSLGGQLSSDVAAVQFGAQMQVFGVGANGHAYGDVWDPDSGWSGWRDMGGQFG